MNIIDEELRFENARKAMTNLWIMFGAVAVSVGCTFLPGWYGDILPRMFFSMGLINAVQLVIRMIREARWKYKEIKGE